MISMEVAMNITDVIFTGGAILTWWVIPLMLRSDRGPEFKNAIMKEFLALVGMRHRFGMPWRPVEQSGVERIHQEMQKILGII